MNNIKTTRSILSAVIVAAALGLVACGGGDDKKDVASVLPAGKVGTIGDGVNASEFAAIQCGMNKDQVLAIIGDAPTRILGLGENYSWEYPTYGFGAGFYSTGNLMYHVLSAGKEKIGSLNC